MTSARFCLFRLGLNVLQNGSEQLFILHNTFFAQQESCGIRGVFQ